jgi:diketogulonate reductase-like aldo/keto reductase
MGGFRCAALSRKELPGLQSDPLGARSYRYLSSLPPRSQRSHRGHDQRHRRSCEGRLCPLRRVVRSRTIRRAQAVHPISDLQVEYSLVSRGPETGIFPVLEELGIGVTVYGVLSRGLLSGSRPAAKGDFRAHLPRFTGENLTQNQRLVEVLKNMSAEKGARPSQLAIAWVVAKGKSIVPVIGARTRNQLVESLNALRIQLSPAEVARIEEAIPAAAVAGTRYDEHQMKMLDSER